MKYFLLLLAAVSVTSLVAEETKVANEVITVPVAKTTTFVCNQPQSACECASCSEARKEMSLEEAEPILMPNSDIRIAVTGQGVAPMSTTSPAQAYALAKRAAIADSYRLIAEKVKGVRVEGQDVIKNMMVKRSTVRTYVDAMVREANIIETTFKEGLCEVEMEIVLSYSQFAR